MINHWEHYARLKIRCDRKRRMNIVRVHLVRRDGESHLSKVVPVYRNCLSPRGKTFFFFFSFHVLDSVTFTGLKNLGESSTCHSGLCVYLYFIFSIFFPFYSFIQSCRPYYSNTSKHKRAHGTMLFFIVFTWMKPNNETYPTKCWASKTIIISYGRKFNGSNNIHHVTIVWNDDGLFLFLVHTFFLTLFMLFHSLYLRSASASTS